MSAFFQPFGVREDHGPRLGSDYIFKGYGFDATTNLGWADAEGLFTLWRDGEAILDEEVMERLPAGVGVVAGWLRYRATADILDTPGRYRYLMVLSSPALDATLTYRGVFVL